MPSPRHNRVLAPRLRICRRLPFAFRLVPAACCLLPLAFCLLASALPSHAAAADRWHTFTAANGLAGNIVQAIWESPDGAIWFGTENGASRYDGRTWATFAEGDGLIDSNVWAISGDDQSVWFATSRGLSRLRDGAWLSYGLADGLPGIDVRAVLVAADGTVWVGTFGRGIARLRPGAARWESVDVLSRPGPQGPFVQAIWQAPGGDLWFATNGIGALRLRGGSFELFSFRLGNRNTVWSVGAAPAGDTIYLGTFVGLAQIDGAGQARVFDDMVQGVPLSATEILAVAGDRSGGLWLGTRAQGVLHRDAAGWSRIAGPDQISRSYVQTILADRAGRLWFGTRGGGVSLRDPRPLGAAELRPGLQIAAALDGSPLTLSDAPLPAAANDLLFRFTLPLDWVPPDAISFRYRLTRSSEAPGAWRSAQAAPRTPVRAASTPFIDLGPGRYTLAIVAEVAGVSGAESQVQFTIASAPPALDPPTLTAERQPIEAGLSLPQDLLAGSRRVDLALTAADDADRPADLRYEYRLGPDAPWQPAPGGRATLELATGTYQIAARVIDAEGHPSPPTTLRVVVPAPLWPTVLLALLVVLVPSVASGVAGALAYRRWARRQALLRAVRGFHIPYDVGPLITAPDRYIGRGSVIDTIVGKIAQNSFYIYGEKRIGKTSLLLQVRDRLAQRDLIHAGPQVLPVFRNIQDLSQEQFWLYLMRSVAGAMALTPRPDRLQGPIEHLSGGAGAYGPYPLSPSSAAQERNSLLACLGQPAAYDDLDAEDDLQRMVGRCAQPTLIVLLLDEIDTLERYDPAVRQRFRAFCQHAQAHLRVVVAGVRPPAAEPGDTSPWYNIFERVTLGPLSEPEARRLIRAYNQNPYAYTAAAEEAILRAGARKPFDTQWLCSEAVRAMLAERRGGVRHEHAERAVRVVLEARADEYAAAWRLLAPLQQAALRQGPATLEPTIAARLLSEGLIAPAPEGGYRAVGLWAIWIGLIV